MSVGFLAVYNLSWWKLSFLIDLVIKNIKCIIHFLCGDNLLKT